MGCGSRGVQGLFDKLKEEVGQLQGLWGLVGAATKEVQLQECGIGQG
jgi:hypothetical protein